MQHGPTNDRMVQNVLLIWLDNSIDVNSADGQSKMFELQRISDTIYTFDDQDQCIDFLTDTHTDEAYMIISGALSQNIVPVIQNVAQLKSIFILCQEQTDLSHGLKIGLKSKVSLQILHLYVTLLRKLHISLNRTPLLLASWNQMKMSPVKIWINLIIHSCIHKSLKK